MRGRVSIHVDLWPGPLSVPWLTSALSIPYMYMYVMFCHSHGGTDDDDISQQKTQWTQFTHATLTTTVQFTRISSILYIHFTAILIDLARYIEIVKWSDPLAKQEAGKALTFRSFEGLNYDLQKRDKTSKQLITGPIKSCIMQSKWKILPVVLSPW